MGLLDRFTRPKYEALFHDFLRQIGTASGAEIRIHPDAAAAIVQTQMDTARKMKRYGVSGSRTIAGLPIEHSLVKTAALMTAYILAGTQVMPASEAEREPYLGSIRRDIAPALLAHDLYLSDAARERIARIVDPNP